MKTPKREYKKYYICPATGEPDEWTLGNIDARRKRKNRIRQLKHTIAILTRKLRDTKSLSYPTIGANDTHKSGKN